MGILVTSLLAICTVLLSLIIKKDSPVIASLMAVTLSIFIIIRVANGLSVLISQINIISKNVAVDDEYMKIIFKVLGLTYITQFSSDICKDNGLSCVASQLEIMCRITIAALSIPIVIALMETINKCLN
ncbi:MAG: SpoIIIAC/SpoIIIAD family protein [Lachnospira sp.]